MKLLTNGFTTAATTLAGTTAVGTTGAQASRRIDKVVVQCGGTTIAPAGTDGLVSLRYGHSSGSILSTMTICPQPFSVGSGGQGPFQMELSDLGIRCKWFEAVTNTTCEGGVGVFIFGE